MTKPQPPQSAQDEQVPNQDLSLLDLDSLTSEIKAKALELGFQDTRITDTDTAQHFDHLKQWLENNHHGDMTWMGNNLELRKHPEQLHLGTARIISVRMDYMQDQNQALEILNNPEKAYISRYALGRDYHKLLRKRLTELGKFISSKADEHGFRGFVDSAPVLERAFAEKSGMGWIGKNTMLINSKAGSYFFLGELFTNLPLPVDPPLEHMHCGSCTSCLELCPTDAFKGPHQLDAKRCISYLTIEYSGVIDEELRPLMGNRIYGCDDCQVVCPWNKFTQETQEQDFSARNQLDDISLQELFSWEEKVFLKKTEGSPIRRAGYAQWQRNIAIALGNSPANPSTLDILQNALEQRWQPILDTEKAAQAEMVIPHIEWAITQQKTQNNA